jgi:hypothetical protein
MSSESPPRHFAAWEVRWQTVLVLSASGLAWGYLRLPWAAVRTLDDYQLVARALAVSLSHRNVSTARLRYLKHSLRALPLPVVPRASVAATWNALVFAWVHSDHYLGNLGAEDKDGLYFCLFGAWIPVYTYGHEMA